MCIITLQRTHISKRYYDITKENIYDISFLKFDIIRLIDLTKSIYDIRKSISDITTLYRYKKKYLDLSFFSTFFPYIGYDFLISVSMFLISRKRPYIGPYIALKGYRCWVILVIPYPGKS